MSISLLLQLDLHELSLGAVFAFEVAQEGRKALSGGGYPLCRNLGSNLVSRVLGFVTDMNISFDSAWVLGCCEVRS